MRRSDGQPQKHTKTHKTDQKIRVILCVFVVKTLEINKIKLTFFRRGLTNNHLTPMRSQASWTMIDRSLNIFQKQNYVKTNACRLI